MCLNPGIKSTTENTNKRNFNKINNNRSKFSFIQCCASSPAKHGGAYFSAVVWSTILATTEKAIGRRLAPPILVKFHLARTFGATGKEQPSPPLHLAAAARLLRQFRGQASKWDLFAQNHLDFSHFSF